MADFDAHAAMAKPARRCGLLAALSASLMLGACAQMGGEDSAGLFSSLAPATQSQAASPTQPSDPRAATEYWGKQYASNPRNLDSALSYAQNLVATGRKREALNVLQQAAQIHGTDRRLASDYGRLALDLDQISVAKKVLEIADDPANPNWRVVLARGTAAAKEGSYREAISFYERAQALNPGHPSVLNNLALAYTMTGEPERGEQLLRQAAAAGSDNAKVRQNLALVLGLQGKYEESTKVASSDLATADAQANAALLKKMVRLDAKPMTPPQMPSEESWAPAIAAKAPPSKPRAQPVAAASAPAVAPRAAAAAPVLRASKIETGFETQAGDNRAAGLFTAE